MAKLWIFLALPLISAFPTEFPPDPELELEFLGIAKRWDYEAEEHFVTTADGYILTIHRIPNKQHQKGIPNCARPTVFLQHGMEGSSASWILNLPSQSAGFTFADAGFDVWLGNFRGNVMGTMAAFAEFSTNHQLEQKIREFHALGPVASVAHIKGLFAWLADRYQFVQELLKDLGWDQFLPPDWLTRLIAEDVCEDADTYKDCDNLLFLISGNSNQLNETRVPVYLNHMPSGTSTNVVIQMAQNVKAQKFQMFDYDDEKENQKHYGQPTPPKYAVEDMTLPTRLYWGFNDTLADPLDIQSYLIPRLQSMRSQKGYDGFAHIDFEWGLKAHDQVFGPIIEYINEDWKNWKGQEFTC
ncbi:unnamed protein product, partial [Mesorhabditis spiculigera]